MSDEATTAPLRVAIVDDHALYRAMLESVLRTVPGLTVEVIASTVSEAKRRIRPGEIDVAIIDVDLPDGNGVSLGIDCRRDNPALGILLVSSQDVMEFLIDLPRDVRRGWSFLSKNSPLSSTETLVDALRATAAGATVLDPRLIAEARPRRGSALAALSPRQYEVLLLVAQGLSNAGVSERLGISPRSVENHLNVIYAALDLPAEHNSRVSAVLRFIEDSSYG